MTATINKIKQLIGQYGSEACIAEVMTRKGVTTMVIGVSTTWHKALISNLQASKFCKKGDEYALQTKSFSVVVNNMDEVIIVRFPA